MINIIPRAGGQYWFLKKAAVCLSVCLLAVSFLTFPAVPASGAEGYDFSEMAALLGDRDAAMVAAPDRTVLFSHNPEAVRIPASTIKLFTALAAFHYLTADFRFTTEIFMDNHANLKIKGNGDPLLISEVVSDIAVTLADEQDAASHRLNNLYLDNTFFTAPIAIPGVSGSTEPYDAPIGALCVNFNTVNFRSVEGTSREHCPGSM